MTAYEIFLTGMVGGGILELLYAEAHHLITGKPFRRNHRFTIGKKVGMFTLPIWGVLALLVTHSTGAIVIFFVSAVIGTALECLLGWVFPIFFGVKLWVYNPKTAIGEFTSIYSPPYWGGAGLMFFAIGELLTKL